jgi:hypothetical protein
MWVLQQAAFAALLSVAAGQTSAVSLPIPVVTDCDDLSDGCPANTQDDSGWTSCKCTVHAGYTWADETCTANDDDANTCTTVTAGARCKTLIDAHADTQGSTAAQLTCGCVAGYRVHPAGCGLAAGTCTCESFDDACTRLAGDGSHNEGATELECAPDPGFYFSPAGCDYREEGACSSILTPAESARRISDAPEVLSLSNRQCCPGEDLYFAREAELLNQRPSYATHDGSAYLYWSDSETLGDGGAWVQAADLADDGMFLAKLPSSSLMVPLGAGGWEEYFGVVNARWTATESLTVAEVPDARWGCMNDDAENFDVAATADDTTCAADLSAAASTLVLTGIGGEPFYFQVQSELLNNRPHYATRGGMFQLYWTQSADGGAMGGRLQVVGSQGGWVVDDDTDDAEYRAFIHSNSLAVPLGAVGWKEGADYSPAAVAELEADVEWGCTDPAAANFSPQATADDESCNANLDTTARVVCVSSADAEGESGAVEQVGCLELQPDLVDGRPSYVGVYDEDSIAQGMLSYSLSQRAWLLELNLGDGRVLSTSLSVPAEVPSSNGDDHRYYIADSVDEDGAVQLWDWQQSCLDVHLCFEQDLEHANARGDRQLRDLLPPFHIRNVEADGWSIACVTCLERTYDSWLDPPETEADDCSSEFCAQISSCIDATICETSDLTSDMLDVPTDVVQIGVKSRLRDLCSTELMSCLTTRGCDDELDAVLESGEAANDASPELEALIACNPSGVDFKRGSWGEILVRASLFPC